MGFFRILRQWMANRKSRTGNSPHIPPPRQVSPQDALRGNKRNNAKMETPPLKPPPPDQRPRPTSKQEPHRLDRTRQHRRWWQASNIGEMVYIDKEIDREGWPGWEARQSTPALPVAKNEKDIPGDTLPYWPNYEDIQPAARASYLDWLGKRTVRPAYKRWVTSSCTSTE